MTTQRFIGVIGLLVAIGIGWRLASRRWAIPCPAWLGWSLENPIFDRISGTQQTLNRAGLRPGQRVLEVGPGPGRLLIPAAGRVLPGGEVVGIDIQEGMIDQLRERAEKAGVSNLTAVLGDVAVDDSLPGASFDVIIIAHVLGEIREREAALRQCFGLLKPGGTLSIAEALPDPHYQSQETVRVLAEAAGFQPAEIFGNRLRFTANFIRP